MVMMTARRTKLLPILSAITRRGLVAVKIETKGMKELTPAGIDKLQNYFGIALCKNRTTVEPISPPLPVMKKITNMFIVKSPR